MAGTSLNVESLFSATGMNCLITGGGTGIGLMMAKALADAGANRVYIVGRRVEILQEAAAKIGKPSVIPLYCDVTSKVSLESAVKVVESDAGHLNLLVCNAGISGPQVKAPFSDGGATTLEQWRQQQLAIGTDEYTKTFEMNCTSVWFTTMAFLKLLDEGNKKGNLSWTSQVIVTSSIAGFNRKSPGGMAYGQSKAAATHIMRQLAVTLPVWNIRANCIAPGLYPSEMSAPIVHAAGGSLDSETTLIPMSTSIVPMGRMGDASDMAGNMLYLASRAGAYLNGTIIVSDGGRLGTFPSTGY